MRQFSLQDAIFALYADSDIPVSPSVGLPYRNEKITRETAGKGMRYDTPFSSSDFNEILYRATSVLDCMEKTAGVEWSELTTYSPGDLCRGENYSFWRALKPSGQRTEAGPQVPSDTSDYWELARFIVKGLPSETENVVFTATDYTAVRGDLIFCRNGLNVTLPDTPEDLDRVTVATSLLVNANSPVYAYGRIEGEYERLSIAHRNAMVQFLWKQDLNCWKVIQASGGNRLRFNDQEGIITIGGSFSDAGDSDSFEGELQGDTIEFTLRTDDTLMGEPNESYEYELKVNNDDGILTREQDGLFVADGLPEVMPAGTILYYAGMNSEMPENFIPCDGREVDRTRFGILFKVIGTSCGIGDGSRTFNVPDLRDCYLQGYQEGKSSDLGARQAESLPALNGWFGGAMQGGHTMEGHTDGRLFVGTDENAGGAGGKENLSGKRTYFDMSKANQIYGKSEHVSLHSYSVMCYIYAGRI